jgi:hypothetical protein
MELQDYFQKNTGKINREEFQRAVLAIKAAQVDVIYNLSTDEVVSNSLLDPEKALQNPEYQLLPTALLDNWRQQLNNNRDSEQGRFMQRHVLPFCQEMTRELVRAGVRVSVGSDVGDVGSLPYLVHRDMAMLVEAGLTPYEALRAATTHPAAVINRITKGKAAVTGTLTAGAPADLVVLRGNPLDNINHTRDRVGVLIGGRWLTQQQLNDLRQPAVNGVSNDT